MKKMNNKGFLLIETLIVSAFVLGVLVIIFLQFKTLLVNYNHTYDYNTVEGIYNLNAVKTYLNENQGDKTLNSYLNSAPYLLIYDGESCSEKYGLKNIDYCNQMMKAAEFKKVIYTKSELDNLKNNMNDFNEKTKDFIKKLNSKSNENRLIAEYTNETYASITYGINNE